MRGRDIRVLVADADSAIREIVAVLCREQGFVTDAARDGVEAIRKLRRNTYTFLILELELPVIDGLMVCEQYSARSLAIILSSRKSEADLLDAFACGASDFILKPFYPRELIARMNNLLKLSGIYESKTRVLKTGDIEIDLESQLVRTDGALCRLSPREYDLLLFLCRNANKLFSRKTLLDMVWGADFDGMDRTVDTHIKSLRDKLKTKTCLIETVWGAGYKLTEQRE